MKAKGLSQRIARDKSFEDITQWQQKNMAFSESAKPPQKKSSIKLQGMNLADLNFVLSGKTRFQNRYS